MKYQVMPDLTPIEYEALKADIAERGVLVPIEVDEDGAILDGHHRDRAWTELRSEGMNLPDYPRMVRRGLTEEQKRNHARSLNVLRRHLSKEQRDEVMKAMARDGASPDEIAQAVGVSHMTVRRTIDADSTLTNVKVERVGKDGKKRPSKYRQRTYAADTIALFVPGAAVALEPAAAERTAKQHRQERTTKRRQERTENINKTNQGNTSVDELDQTFSVIYADPPWRYEHANSENRAIENHYPTMDLGEICRMPVSEIAAKDAVLFLWATPPKLAEAMQVVYAWGFVYRTCMVWDKEMIGMGYYARQQHELLLIAARGELPVPEPANRPASVVRIKRLERHSAKPTEFYELIERMYPEFVKIELFARNTREGWSAWGNQAKGNEA